MLSGWRGLNLTAVDLREIADALDQLKEIRAVQISSAQWKNYTLTLDVFVGDQRDGPQVRLTGIHTTIPQGNVPRGDQ